jgi:hypothetical protein
MLRRYLVGATVLGLLIVLPVQARGQESKTPGAVIRIKSLDGLIEDVTYVAKLAGQEEEVKQGVGFLRSFLGEKGDEAIDPTRPIGFYASISGDFLNSNGAFLLPVGNEKKIISLFEQFGGQAKKDEDGLYTISHPGVQVPIPIYMRIEHKYAYVTMQNKAALNKENLLEPSKVFGDAPLKTVSISLSLDRVPGDIKELVLGFIDARFAEEQSKKEPGATDAQNALKVEVLKEIAKNAATLVKESNRIDVIFDVDKKANELVFDATLTPRKGSTLANEILNWNKQKSLVAGLAKSDAAASMMAHVIIPDKLKQALEPVIDEGLAKALENVSAADERAQAEKFFKALAPTLKSGELDIAGTLLGPSADKHHTIVAGLKVKDGFGIETAFKEAIRFVPERDRAAFKFDVEKIGNMNVHRIELQPLYNEQMRAVVGNHPIHIAARADVVLVAVGPEGAKALKEAAAVAPASGALLASETAMSRIIPLIGEVQAAQGNKISGEAMEKIAKEAFGELAKGNDVVRFSITGGEQFKARYTLKASAFQFITRTGMSYRAREAAAND